MEPQALFEELKAMLWAREVRIKDQVHAEEAKLAHMSDDEWLAFQAEQSRKFGLELPTGFSVRHRKADSLFPGDPDERCEANTRQLFPHLLVARGDDEGPITEDQLSAASFNATKATMASIMSNIMARADSELDPTRKSIFNQVIATFQANMADQEILRKPDITLEEIYEVAERSKARNLEFETTRKVLSDPTARFGQ